MHGRKLLWQLYPSYLLITLVSLAALTWYTSRSLRDFYLARTAADLEVRARFLEDRVLEGLACADTGYVNVLCREYGRKGATRITVILPTGRVVGDSDEQPLRMDNHGDRPEVIEALAGRTGTSIRFSHTLQEDMMYLALPVEIEERIAGVLRASVPLTAINRILGTEYKKIALGTLVAALLAALVSLLISRWISRPLEELTDGAERFARGELEHKLPVPNIKEIGALAEGMNRMAARLDNRINTVQRQRNELEALLSSMNEGVLAVDTGERIINVNQAAGQLLEIDPAKAQGRSIQEAVRNSDLQRFVKEALASPKPVESEITLYSGDERLLQANGTLLRGAGGQRTGILIVLNDVSRIKHLENIRREFVANVSHELKTPVTSIKGFVETLLDGAMRDPRSLERFLGIISKQAGRLEAIIDDILSLSRIEQEAEKIEIILEEGPLADVLNAAVQYCSIKAEKKKIAIELECPADLSAKVNAQLLEQAVANLIDNAVKNSDPESTVQVEALRTDTELIIRVRDHGCGIEKEHLPRLFERFYRVDKARSRDLGGTGLGLAIVKHITQVHGGSIEVDSTPGQGSLFSIHLPGTL
ncbi:MAG: ATP-binding protein [Gemmatimonadota bacterium]|nr:ATP-binding protein [Gemmatimonadota bacterium]